MVASKIEKDINQGKGVIVFPSPSFNIKWQKIDSKEKPFLLHTSKIGDFWVASLEAGTYYVKSISIKSSRKRTLNHTEEYSSAIGNIIVERTPEKELVEKTIKRKGKFSEWEETKEVVVNLASYYNMEYIFTNNEAIGKITIKPNEIVLIPSVWIDISLARKSCEQTDGSFLNGLGNFIDNIAHLIDFKGGDDFQYLYWNCPIEEFLVDTSTSSIENFLTKADKKYFPDGILDKIVVRDFEIGSALKNAEKTEETTNDITTIQYKIEKLE